MVIKCNFTFRLLSLKDLGVSCQRNMSICSSAEHYLCNTWVADLGQLWRRWPRCGLLLKVCHKLVTQMAVCPVYTFSQPRLRSDLADGRIDPGQQTRWCIHSSLVYPGNHGCAIITFSLRVLSSPRSLQFTYSCQCFRYRLSFCIGCFFHAAF